ncbi:ACT domain-containing protein [Candidatus Omnitrophota bacterium]
MSANKIQHLEVVAVDKPGMLAEVSGAIAAEGINMEALCAYSWEGNAMFYIHTTDNAKVKEALKSKGWRVKEDEVVIVDLENKPGALSDLSANLKAKGVNLMFAYGSTCGGNCACRIILKAEDNEKIIKALA